MATEPQQDHTEDSDLEQAPEVEELDIEQDPVDPLEALRTERDEAVAARQRAMADFSNFQRRSAENETRARSQGIAEVVRNLVPVLDQFDMALGQAESATNMESLIEGISLVKDGFMQALERNGVKPITPSIDEEFDPMRHEAMMNQPAEGVAPGHVSMVVQPGWEMGSIVLRPAKVAVAPAASSDAEDGKDA